VVAGTDNGIKTLDEESEQHFQEALEEELSPSGSRDLQGVEADDVPLQVMRRLSFDTHHLQFSYDRGQQYLQRCPGAQSTLHFSP